MSAQPPQSRQIRPLPCVVTFVTKVTFQDPHSDSSRFELIRPLPSVGAHVGEGLGGALASPAARNSQRWAFNIGFAVKLIAQLSARPYGVAMPVFSVPYHSTCAFWLLCGCIAFSTFRACRPSSTQDPRQSQCP